MLGDNDVTATIAVKNLSSSRSFYEDKLGLSVHREDPDPAGGGGIQYKSGNTYLYVYESPNNAGTNQATSAGWQTSDINATVEGLKEKGVTFEHYDMPGVTHDGDVHVFGEYRTAWFKDPDGNIFALDNRGRN